MKKLSFTVNGVHRQLLVDPSETLSFVLRERLSLVGTKIGCGEGSCGACTVLVDGTAVQSCLYPALKVAGKEVLTIESVAENGKLHPLQALFVEKGAIQCGYCTPGMVMSALSYLKEHPNPTEEELRDAVSGNLCRCTGYIKVIEAIMAYSRGEKARDHGVDQSATVGKPRPYVEAVSKVKGSAQFADDFRKPNVLFCAFLRSPYPHARIDSIDTSNALNSEGVVAVITGKDLPTTFGVLPISEDETAMAVEKTRYVGEIVAVVAAEEESMARAACNRIDVRYTPLRPFLEMEDSLGDAGDDERIHTRSKFNNNIHKKAELRFGNQQEGLKKCAHRSTMSFDFKGVNHGFTEPLAATAWWDENGLTIVTATQVPHYLHRYLARVMGVPMNRIRVIKPALGGGFGGKSDPFPHEMIVAHLARITGRPVRTRFTREEVFLNNHGRHPTKMTMDVGLSKDGILEVLDADIVIDGGAYGSFGVVTTYYNGVLLQAPYKVDNFGFRTRRVYTNKPQCGAMRGHGAVNSRFAIESMLDEMAYELRMDPGRLRMKNFISSDTITVGQYRITSNGARESLETVMKQSKWDEKFGKLPRGKGIGLACGFFISGSALPIHWNEYPQSVVHLKVDMDGRVLITSGASDIGQGSDTMLAIIVGEVLGLDMDYLQVVAADTLLTPIDLGSYSSRVTFMAGNAARVASEKLLDQVLKAVSKDSGISVSELSAENGRVFSADRSIDLSWVEAVEIATRKLGALQSTGAYNSPKLGGDFKGAGAGLSPSYSFGAVVCEVDVDCHTGMVQIDNIWGAHDCGKALNPLAVEGQLQGSWHMGLGQAISEEMIYKDGMLLNASFLNYKIPLASDTPPISTNIIETCDPEGPFGAKECGEGALHPVIPAIANAIRDAVGVRLRSLPMTPDKILAALNEQKTPVKP